MQAESADDPHQENRTRRRRRRARQRTLYCRRGATGRKSRVHAIIHVFFFFKEGGGGGLEQSLLIKPNYADRLLNYYLLLLLLYTLYYHYRHYIVACRFAGMRRRTREWCKVTRSLRAKENCCLLVWFGWFFFCFFVFGLFYAPLLLLLTGVAHSLKCHITRRSFELFRCCFVIFAAFLYLFIYFF